MEEEQEPTLNEMTKEIYEKLKNANPKDIKKMKIFSKAKTNKSKIKKGWVGVLKVSENGSISGEKVKIEGSAFDTKDKITHASDGREVLFWDGKYPVLVQKSWKLNPENMNKNNEKDETYGQPYVKAKMLFDVLKPKTKGNIKTIVIIGIIAVAAYFIYTKFFGGG